RKVEGAAERTLTREPLRSRAGLSLPVPGRALPRLGWSLPVPGWRLPALAIGKKDGLGSAPTWARPSLERKKWAEKIPLNPSSVLTAVVPGGFEEQPFPPARPW